MEQFVLVRTSVKGDKPVNQDAIRTYEDDNLVILALADGLGSAPDSRTGSQAACNAVIHEVKASFKKGRGLSSAQIVSRWVKNITRKGKESKDCLTTSSFVILNKKNRKVTVGIIGDSQIYLETDGQKREFLSDKDFLNETDCLGMHGKVQYRISTHSYDYSMSAMIASDGICDEIDSGKAGDFLDYLKENYTSVDSHRRNLDLSREIKKAFSMRNNDDKSITALWMK